MARPKKNEEKELPFGVDEAFMNSLNTMSTQEIKGLLAQLELQKDEAEQMKELPGYKEAKYNFDLVKGPFSDTKRSLKNRTKAAIGRLKEKGGA